MRIERLEIQDKSRDWKLNTIEFDNFTLLVGASGVGKTMIINSLLQLKEIAAGNSFNGLEWDVTFKAAENFTYRWLGSFEAKEQENVEADALTGNEEDYDLEYEKLYLNDELVVERDREGIIGKNKKVEAQSNISLIRLLRGKDVIKPAVFGIDKIIISDESKYRKGPLMTFSINEEKMKTKYQSLEQIVESNEDIVVKLMIIYNNHKDVFDSIKEKFIDIFPSVEDIRIDTITLDDELLFYTPAIMMKEKGVSEWIPGSKISSGMFRTLMHLSEVNLCSQDSVILMDEFDNNFGTNCIEKLMPELISHTDRIQFILTSHHPFIIVKTDFSHWKLVTRNGSEVRTFNAEELDLGDSRFRAFIKLIGMDEYHTGITLH